jgi:hypothetical protein
LLGIARKVTKILGTVYTSGVRPAFVHRVFHYFGGRTWAIF